MWREDLNGDKEGQTRAKGQAIGWGGLITGGRNTNEHTQRKSHMRTLREGSQLLGKAGETIGQHLDENL